MRKTIVCLMALLFMVQNTLMAQSQVVADLSNALVELTGSFMDNPGHHSNTIKVYDLTQQFKKTIDEIFNKALYSDHPQASSDLPYLRNMKTILKCLDFIVANIAGYSRGGFDATEWDVAFNPMLIELDWSYKIIHSTEDVIFYEYSKNNFKMVLAKNILPKKDYGDYNAVAFACDSWNSRLKRVTSGTRRVVYGGNYQFVTFGDDENKYHKISKVASKRGTSFDSFK